MQSRYEDFLLDNSPKTFRTTIYPEIPRDERDTYIITRDTDRLDLLSGEYYQNVALWWIIAAANNLGKGTLCLDPGIQLRIPHDPQTVIKLYEQLNEPRG